MPAHGALADRRACPIAGSPGLSFRRAAERSLERQTANLGATNRGGLWELEPFPSLQRPTTGSPATQDAGWTMIATADEDAPDLRLSTDEWPEAERRKAVW